MLRQKNKNMLRLYFCACTLFLGLTVFEVPKIVFLAPVLLFSCYILFSVFMKESMNINAACVLLLVFAVVYTYFIYTDKSGIYYQSYIYIQAFMLYFMGINFFPSAESGEKRRMLENVTIVICVLYILYNIIILVNHYTHDTSVFEERLFRSLWYSDMNKAATVISMSFALPLAYGCYAIFFSSAVKKITGVVFILLTLVINVFTGTRSLILFFPVVFLFVMFSWLIFKKKKYVLSISLFALFAVAAAVFIYICKAQSEKIYELLHDKSIYRLFELRVFDDLRFVYTKNVLDNFSFTYMGGGAYTASAGIPHNVWLFFYDKGGIVPFIVYCVFTVLVFFDGVRFMLCKKLTLDEKMLVLSLFSVILFEFNMEPLILPLPSFYIISMFVLGSFRSFAPLQKKR